MEGAIWPVGQTNWGGARSPMVRILAFISAFFLTLLFVGLLAGGYFVWRLNQDLPDYSKLANYEPPVVTRQGFF